MTNASLWDSVASTRTMQHLRTTSLASWRVGWILFAMCLIWALLEPGSLVESRLPTTWRWHLEAQRLWLGPLLFVPVAAVAVKGWLVHRRSPSLPGRPTLVSLTLMGWVGLCLFVPLQVIDRQAAMTDEASKRLLPMAHRALLFKQTLPPVIDRWVGTPRARAVVDVRFVAVVDLPWHPAGGLGIDREGTVSSLVPPT